jgi:DNA-binding PucR family transcriptional regulator
MHRFDPSENETATEKLRKRLSDMSAKLSLYGIVTDFSHEHADAFRITTPAVL